MTGHDDHHQGAPRPQLFVSPYLHAPNLTRRPSTPSTDADGTGDDGELDVRHVMLLTPPTAPPPVRVPTRRDGLRRVLAGLRPSWMPALSSLRTVVATLLLIASVGFCGYVVWDTQGSQLVAERNQDDLRQLYNERLTGAAAIPPSVVVPTSPASGSTPTADTVTSPATPGNQTVEPVIGADPTASASATTGPSAATLVTIPMGTPGDVGGHLVIPSIGVDQILVVGTRAQDLERGPGIWIDGVMPGMPGNATLAAHRTTYGGPFRNIDKLQIGDLIYVDVPGQPTAVYEVRGSTVVSPSQVGVTAQGDGVRLTLTTCEPVGSASKRLVVQAELVQGTFIANALGPDGWTMRT